MAMHRLSTNLIICLHWPSLKPLADIRLLLQLLIPRTQIHLNVNDWILILSLLLCRPLLL